MYTISITSTKRDRVVETGVEFLEVAAAIAKDGETVAEKRLGFPLDSTKESIEAELQAVLSAFVIDEELAAKTKQSEQINANADQLEAALSGVVITHESN